MDCGHYTSQSGLLGIVTNQNIWATNIKYLNDEHEFLDALELIREIIPTSKITPDFDEHALHKEYLQKLEKRLNNLDVFVSESVFIFSLSEETDLLSQWRGYCPENNGYCLIFDIESLFESVKEKFQNSYLVKCVYEKEKKEAKLRELLNKYWNLYMRANSKKEKNEIIYNFSTDVSLLASHFKHPSFSEEKERRIVIITDSEIDENLKFREGKFSLIPYIELPVTKENIKQICIGPTSNRELSRRSLEMLLEKIYGLDFVFEQTVDVAFSKTPYRSW